jgi:hypothetical protein
MANEVSRVHVAIILKYGGETMKINATGYHNLGEPITLNRLC